MPWTNTPTHFGRAAQLFHWLTVMAVGVAWLIGQLRDEFPKGLARQEAGFIHTYAGELIATLLIVRLLWRMFDASPTAGSETKSKWAHYAVLSAHFFLYTLLAGAVVAGVATQFAKGNPISVFGLYEIASPWPKDKFFAHSLRELHEFIANCLIILAILHASAALIHHYILKDNTLNKMLPFFR